MLWVHAGELGSALHPVQHAVAASNNISTAIALQHSRFPEKCRIFLAKFGTNIAYFAFAQLLCALQQSVTPTQKKYERTPLRSKT